MKHVTWPRRSYSSPFSSIPFSNLTYSQFSAAKNPRSSLSPPSMPSSTAADFSSLPYDVLIKIAASFDHPNLLAASLVCWSWCEALLPLREAMLLLQWGKRFKHGRGGVRQNAEKALESFLKAAARGSALAMVDAGLMYWGKGERDKAIDLYVKAAELGNHAAQCNLALSYLQAQPPNTEQALKWLYKASIGGNVRSQYQLALCLHRSVGVRSNMKEAAKWYLKAAEGGYVRAMYNISLCYSFGEGLAHNRQQARKWMKRAADRGHRKAQFEHGLALFSEGDMMKAVVYLELATRAGETGAAHIKNLVLNRLSAASRDHAMSLADSWRALPSS
ncbi:putative F-box domain, tetratricopeptide-like helical domain-containing protein [Lupinus albus]|uniref:Putative F-box domain, tetratricopeptide-like helical domain-containing protein n=1 Tax=Lupinus albus TaxID=3870 RepID=A0A6A4PAN3_LUPAL|nr:putative F-box domain, tetratricopeptide-like helical domain-containing protein [Lupinus albus]